MAKPTAPMTKIIGIDLSEGSAYAAALVNGQPVVMPQTPGDYSGKMTVADTLRRRKQEAENYLHLPITQAVVSVPVHYSEPARQAIRDAGRQVGLEIRRIINAPSAIAMTYFWQCPGTKENLVVYTLDRNSCSAAVMDLGDGVVEVLSAEGMAFDNPFAEDMIDTAMTPVKQAITAADAIRDHYKQTGNELYPRQHLLLASIGRTSPIRKAISPIVGEQVGMFKSPDGCAAQGAAVQGGILTGEIHNILLVDILNRSMGIETQGGVFSPLAKAGDSFPTHKIQLFTTTEHNQSSMAIHVLQGESGDTSDNPKNSVLWRYRIDNLPPAPKGRPKISITLDCDASGIWVVTATDEDRKQPLTLTPVSHNGADASLPALYDEKAAAEAAYPPPPPPPPQQPKPQPPQQPNIESWELGHAKGVADTLQSLFPVYDNLERAMKQPTIDDAYKKGVELTLKGMLKAFQDMGITPYGAPGDPFDPHLHVAVIHEENSSLGSNVITQVFQKGFKLGDQIIRFATVQVAN